MSLHTPGIDRFNKYYAIDPLTGCWIWQRSINCNGYGMLVSNDVCNSILAHRFSYSYFKGEIPPKMLVCHTCDNTKCVNPEHLFLGTYITNCQDKMKKGRHKPRPIKINRNTTYFLELTNEERENVYFLKRQGIKTSVIAKKYNLSFKALCVHFLKKGLNNPIYKKD